VNQLDRVAVSSPLSEKKLSKRGRIFFDGYICHPHLLVKVSLGRGTHTTLISYRLSSPSIEIKIEGSSSAPEKCEAAKRGLRCVPNAAKMPSMPNWCAGRMESRRTPPSVRSSSSIRHQILHVKFLKQRLQTRTWPLMAEFSCPE